MESGWYARDGATCRQGQTQRRQDARVGSFSARYNIYILYAYNVSLLVRPGQYNLERKLGKDCRNPKNIMLSSSAREVWAKPNAVPGPGEYNVVPLEGGLLRPSHNVLLSDNY